MNAVTLDCSNVYHCFFSYKYIHGTELGKINFTAMLYIITFSPIKIFLYTYITFKGISQ